MKKCCLRRLTPSTIFASVKTWMETVSKYDADAETIGFNQRNTNSDEIEFIDIHFVETRMKMKSYFTFAL